MNFFAALGQAEMEKRALAAGIGAAAKGAWGLSRAGGGNAVSSAWRAGKAGYQSAPAIGRWGGRLANGAFAAPIAYSAYDAVTNERPYDQQQIQMEGYNAAQAGIQKRLSGMGALERHLVQMDPSLLAYGTEQAMPGTIAAWEQQTGQKVSPGPLSSMYQAWNSKGTPNFYSYDGAGGRNYL